MERLGLVGQVEKELEREIGAGLLPRDGKLPSELMLARQFGVSRTTVREALRRLAARGLVVQRPGRRTRAVPFDEALTLENLGVALHERPGPYSECRRLLEGYFALKREATVELLTSCAEHASTVDLDRLGLACFALMDAARWEAPGWVEMEFALLRLAARIVDRPGHLLLVQSLERAFHGMRARLMLHLDAKAVSRWADLASSALMEPAKLRRELPVLLRACDERVLERLAPAYEQGEDSLTLRATEVAAPHADEVFTREESSDCEPDEDPQALHAGEGVAPHAEETLTREGPRVSHGADAVVPQAGEAFTREEPSTHCCTATVAPSAEDVSSTDGSHVEPSVREAMASHAEDASIWGTLPGAVCPNQSACRTGLCEVAPGGSFPFVSAPSDSCRSDEDCVFRGMPSTDSGPSRAAIPEQGEQPFRAWRAAIPGMPSRHSGHGEHRFR